MSDAFQFHLVTHGIHHERIVPHTSQQNCVAERFNRTVMDLVRYMQLHHGMSNFFWMEAFATVVYALNRLCSRSFQMDTTPFHLSIGKATNLSPLRTFSAKCRYALPTSSLTKLDRVLAQDTFLGYSHHAKGYSLWGANAHCIVTARSVRFHEPPSSTASLPAPIKPRLSLRSLSPPSSLACFPSSSGISVLPHSLSSSSLSKKDRIQSRQRDVSVFLASPSWS